MGQVDTIIIHISYITHHMRFWCCGWGPGRLQLIVVVVSANDCFAMYAGWRRSKA